MPSSVSLSILVFKPSHTTDHSVLAAVPGEKHSRLMFSIHPQAILLLYFFILETHSAILISGYRHQGACSLKVHNYSHSICSYCYRMLCFGALGSAGQRSSVESHCLEHSLKIMPIGDLVLMLYLLFSVPTRSSY